MGPQQIVLRTAPESQPGIPNNSACTACRRCLFLRFTRTAVKAQARYIETSVFGDVLLKELSALLLMYAAVNKRPKTRVKSGPE